MFLLRTKSNQVMQEMSPFCLWDDGLLRFPMSIEEKGESMTDNTENEKIKAKADEMMGLKIYDDDLIGGHLTAIWGRIVKLLTAHASEVEALRKRVRELEAEADHSMKSCETRNKELESKLEMAMKVVDAAQTLVDDEESGVDGFGPDVTHIMPLRDALQAYEEEKK